MKEIEQSVAKLEQQPAAGGTQLPFGVLLDVLEVADEAHLAMLNQLSQLDDPETVAWAAGSTGTDEELVREALACLRAGEELPEAFRKALASS